MRRRWRSSERSSPACAGGFERDRQRQLDDSADAPALGGREDARHRQHGGRGPVGLAAREHGGSVGPIIQPRPQNAETVDVSRQLHPARPKIRLQFVPPKPNELESTRASGARRLLLI